MVILVSLLRRLPELSHEQFVRHHRERHAPLVAASPVAARYVRRYVVEHPRPLGVPGVPDPTVDAVVRQWFDSAEDLAALTASADYRDVIRPDEQRFIDMSRSEFYFTREQVFLGDQ